MFGLSHELSMKLTKTLITIHIQVVATIWGLLSPWLTGRENHRTQADEKSARIIKLFIVRAIVCYYPFMYIAFMQKYIEGCPEGPCLPLLQENLAIFFVTQLATMMGTILVQAAAARYAVYSEIKAIMQKKPNADSQYTYCQLQAKCPDFTEDTDDLTELVLAMGFLMMFSVALPAMVCLAFFANFVETKLIANRMLYVNKRPKRVVQLGIGVWATIIRILSLIGVITNSAIACFVFSDTAIDELPMNKRLMTFVLLQNLVIVMRVIIELFVNPVSAPITRAREVNQMVLDHLSGDVGGEVPRKPKKIPYIEV